MEDGVGELIIVVQKFFSASTNSANSPYYAPAYIYEKRYAKTSLSAFITIDSDRWRERRDSNPRPTDYGVKCQD